ncbi:hypothetical protein GCM10022267_31340 [Lentzea roselyniae]|uniref:Uncharacterized protein n=1 Tax=Lentzea roselyniae TaxID=531940 RepID=A0ABP7AWV9_9PSEU
MHHGEHRPATGKPTLAWAFDDEALAAEGTLDGWHALLTNRDPAHTDATEVSRSAWPDPLAHGGVSVRSKSFATCAIERSPR